MERVFSKKIIQEDYEISLKKLNVFITDDEVNRWQKIKMKNGRLVENKSMSVSVDVLFITQHIKNFICRKAYFGKK